MTRLAVILRIHRHRPARTGDTGGPIVTDTCRCGASRYRHRTPDGPVPAWVGSWTRDPRARARELLTAAESPWRIDTPPDTTTHR